MKRPVLSKAGSSEVLMSWYWSGLRKKQTPSDRLSSVARRCALKSLRLGCSAQLINSPPLRPYLLSWWPVDPRPGATCTRAPPPPPPPTPHPHAGHTNMNLTPLSMLLCSPLAGGITFPQHSLLILSNISHQSLSNNQKTHGLWCVRQTSVIRIDWRGQGLLNMAARSKLSRGPQWHGVQADVR